jgi:uncharacterized protein YciI
MIGSPFVFRTDSLEQARDWLATEPYCAAGFREKIEYRPFLPAAGDLVGGTTW